MSEEQLEPIEKLPELPSAIDESGKEISTLSGRHIIEIQHHRLQFAPTGQRHVSVDITITPPSGARRGAVSIAQWNLAYGHGTYERAFVSHIAVVAGIERVGDYVKVSAHVLMREPTRVPTRKWNGYVMVQVIFTG